MASASVKLWGRWHLDTRNGPKSLRFTSHQQQRHLWWVKSLVHHQWDTSHPKTTKIYTSPKAGIFRSLVMVVDFLLKNGVLFFWLKNIQESWNSIVTGFTVLIHNFLIRILQQPRNGRDWICFGDEAFRRGRVPRLFWQIGVEMVPIRVNVVKYYSNQHRFKVAFYTFLVEMLQDARIHCKLIKDWEDTFTAALHRLSCPYHPREVLQWRCSLGVIKDLEGFNRVFSCIFLVNVGTCSKYMFPFSSPDLHFWKILSYWRLPGIQHSWLGSF